MRRKSLNESHPRIVDQWHPTKNGSLTPNDVSKGMRKKVWWKCPKADDHEWQTMIYHKSSGNSKCPFCSGKKASVSNRLDLKFPRLRKEWDPINPPIRNFTYGSGKKVWWKCQKGHSWQSSICNRTLRNRGCPFCTFQKPSELNRFDIYAPGKLLREWNNKKNTKFPSGFSKGSKKKVWWICEEGHEWMASINKRMQKRGCPICQESHGEKAVRHWLDKNKMEYISQARLNPRKMWRYDFYLPDHRIAIEYDGIQHFEYVEWFDKKSQKPLEKRKSRDLSKTVFCFENGIYMIRISYLHVERIQEHLERAINKGSSQDWCLYFTGEEYKEQEEHIFTDIKIIEV